MNRYGKCLKVHAPRPPLFGDPFSVVGFGKVYAKFATEDDAEKAKHVNIYIVFIFLYRLYSGEGLMGELLRQLTIQKRSSIRDNMIEVKCREDKILVLIFVGI